MDDRMKADRERILEKLKKILSKTEERGATKAEAETAAAMAQKMLSEYQLTLLDVELHTFKSSILEESFETAYAKIPAWLWCLAIDVAAGFECQVYERKYRDEAKRWGTRYKAKFTFVGEASDVAVANYFFGMLYYKLWEFAKVEASKHQLSGRDASSFNESFVRGASMEIRERLENERREMKAKNNSVTALIRLKSDAVKNYMAVAHPNMTVAHVNMSVSNWNGLDAGKELGRNIPLTRGVNRNQTQGSLKSQKAIE